MQQMAPRFLRSTLPSSIALGLILSVAGIASSQTANQIPASTVRAVPDRVVKPIDEASRVTLGGTMHPLANRSNDRGAAPDGMKLERLQLVLKRSDAQEAELKQLIGDMHTKGSASYHKWLTPDDFGKRFGPSDADLAKVETWLQSHGFAVAKLNAGRQTLEITGTAGQFRDTFKAPIHTYQVKGVASQQLETHYANAADPQIPAALAPVVGGFASLNNFRLRSHMRSLGKASYNPVTHESKPDWTIGSGSDLNFVLAPADFAVQYSLPSQTTAGINDGTGQSIAIINESNINISLVNRFRTLFGLPANPPQIVIDGNDPGIDGINNSDGENFASGEAYLDVEWAGAVAPAATVNLVIGADTVLESGLAFAAERAVYSNLSPIISISFGGCEADEGSSNGFFAGLWEQAAAQGITVLVSTGDSGSAGCDDPNSQAFAVRGAAVNGLASTPYNVAVGGTDFYYPNGASDYATYWKTLATNGTPTESLKMPAVEQPWNNSQFATTDTFDYYAQNGNTTISAGSGGKSTLGLGTTTGSTTTYGPWPKPVWQTGAGVPADSARDIPDVSLFASSGANASYYPICADDGDCQPASGSNGVQFSGVGGTSASTPSFAGIMALVDQQYGRQGQANFVLYPLAAQFPAAFNDVTAGTIAVPCNTQTVLDGDTGSTIAPLDCISATPTLTGTDSRYGTSSEGEIGLSNAAAYNATTGYDLATGLGSVNASLLLSDWNKVTFAATATTLSVTPPTGATLTSIPHGSAVSFSGTVTGTTPSGDVALMTDSVDPLEQGQATFAVQSGGTYSGSLAYLPGGTYNVWGNYGGDSVNAGSSSIANKVQLTVLPETSSTALQVYALNTATGTYAPIANNASLTYGTQMILSGVPGSTAKTGTTTVPTGNVVFKDGSTAVDTAVVNGEGDAEYYYPIPGGSHAITASYSGDNSYSASTSSAVNFTVQPDTPNLDFYITNQDSSGNITGPQLTYITVIVTNSTDYSVLAAAPSGTITMTGAPAGSVATATLSPAVNPAGINSNYPGGQTEGVATLSIPANTPSPFTFSLQYTSSDTTKYASVNAPGSNQVYSIPLVGAGTGSLTSTTSVTASMASSSPAALVQLTGTVTGQSGHAAPTGTVTVYGPAVIFGTFNLPSGSGSGDTAAISLLFDSGGLIQGSNQFSLQYSGDANYLPSTGTVTVSNSRSDFQMVPLTTIVAVPPSGTATDTINLSSTNSFAGTVSLTCAGAAGITCSLNPAAATLSAGGITGVALTVNYAGAATTQPLNLSVTGTDSTGNYVHTLGFQVVSGQAIAAQPGITVSGTPVTIASQGATGTSTVTVTPTNSYTGSVALTCAITSSPTGATEVPTCSFATASVTVGSAAVTDVLTISTTAPTTTAKAIPESLFPGWRGGGVMLGALFLLIGPLTRRGRRAVKAVRMARILSAAMLFALLAGAATGCGGGSHPAGGGGGGTTGGTTTGAYTITVTATPTGAAAQTTTVAVTVN